MKANELLIGDGFYLIGEETRCQVEGFFTGASKSHLVIYSQYNDGKRVYFAQKSDIEVLLNIAH